MIHKIGNLLLWALAATTLALALLSVAVRVFLLTLDDARPFLTQKVAAMLNADMSVARASSEWLGAYPTVVLEDVTLQFHGAQAVHRFEHVSFSLDMVGSLLELALVPGNVLVLSGSVHLWRMADGSWTLEGMPLGMQRSRRALPFNQLRARAIDVTLQDRAAEGRLHLGLVDADLNRDLQGLEIQARNRQGSPRAGGVEVRARFDAAGSGRVALRVAGMPAEKLRVWLPDWLRQGLAWLPDDVQAWLEAQSTWRAGVPRAIAMQAELVRPAHADWRHMAAMLEWRENGEGDRLRLEDLQLDQGTVLAQGRLDRHGSGMRWALAGLDVAAVRRWAEIVGQKAWAERLPVRFEAGQVLSLHGSRHDAAGAGGLALELAFRDVAITDASGGLRLGKLHGELAMGEQRIRMHLESEALQADYAPWNFSNLQLGSVRMHADGRWDGAACCTLNLREFEVSGPALQMRGSGSLQPEASGRVRLDAEIGTADLPAVSQWVPPGLLLEADEAWARTAFKAGRLRQARLRLDLPLAEEGAAASPFELTLDGGFEEMELDYESPLPLLREARGHVHLDGASLHVVLRAGKILESALSRGAVRIEDLGLMEMQASGLAHGPAEDPPAYLEKVDVLAPGFLATVDLQGASEMSFQFDMPLDERIKKRARVAAQLKYADNRLHVPANDMQLQEVTGKLHFADDRLHGKLRARLDEGAGGPIVIETVKGDLRIAARMKASPKAFMPRAVRPSFDWLSGQSDWDIELLIPGNLLAPGVLSPGRGKRRHVTAVARSNLEGITLDMPKPLGKRQDEGAKAEVRTELGVKRKAHIAINYADRVRAALQATTRRVTGTIYLGSEQPEASPKALVLTGRLAQADLGEWADWLARSAGTGKATPEVSALEIGALTGYGIDLENAKLSARPEQGGWGVFLDAAKMRGSLHVPQASGQPVRGAFEAMHFRMPEAEAEPAPGGARLKPQDLAPLDLTFAHLQLGGYSLQDVALQSEAEEQGLRITQLRAEADHFNADLTGHWQSTQDGEQTLLRGTAHSGNLEKTLNYWSIGHSLRQGDLTLTGTVQWPGAPSDYAFRAVQGQIDLKGRDGRIRHLAPEYARVLALLNLEMIFDRLELDFDDVLRGGFTYQSAEGRFDIRNGSLYTTGFRIVGPSAQFLLVGRIGVTGEDYDLKVIATPETSALLPVAAGAVAGPLGIGVAYLGDKLLEFFGAGINKATTVAYRVTGTWSEPVVEEIVAAGGAGAE